jgi:endonuclease I
LQGSNAFSADIPDILLQWNVEDPVSQFELNRNIILEGIQGNRNPLLIILPLLQQFGEDLSTK